METWILLDFIIKTWILALIFFTTVMSGEVTTEVPDFDILNRTVNYEHMDGLWDLDRVDHEHQDQEVGEEGDWFEGDMLLDEEQKDALMNRKAIKFTNYYWPENIVYYRISASSKPDTEVIESAIRHWENSTCLSFKWADSDQQNYINFIKNRGCYSHIGRQASLKPQPISIGRGCAYLGKIAHEIGHAIGFFHEQSRGDRDKYIKIQYENIKKTQMRNFANSGHYINTYKTPYDMGSLMHYGGKYFSKNGKLTIQTRDPSKQKLIGQRKGLSKWDKILARQMYRC